MRIISQSGRIDIPYEVAVVMLNTKVLLPKLVMKDMQWVNIQQKKRQLRLWNILEDLTI